MSELTPEVLAAVLEHMNQDHCQDNVVIAQAYGAPEAISAEMIDLSAHHGVWRACLPEGQTLVHVQWPEPLTDRRSIRAQVMAVHLRAQQRLTRLASARNHRRD